VYRLNQLRFVSESSIVLCDDGMELLQNSEIRGNYEVGGSMSSETPYAPPQALPPTAKPSLMLWIACSIFGSTVIGGGLGLVLGVMIGKFAPGYYRGVFSNGSDPSFDPLAVGVGLGLTQGAAFGAVIGIVSVMVYLWYRSRLEIQDRI
jgi:hypothetical protein